MAHLNLRRHLAGSSHSAINPTRAFAAVGALTLVIALGACGNPPAPDASVEPSVQPSASVASSQLAFERKEDGGFSAEFIVHPLYEDGHWARDGALEVRQLGKGYPNWIYQVGPGVAIQMTDEQGRLLFAPRLTCNDPDRQSEMISNRVPAVQPGEYDALLTIEESDGTVSADLRLTGVDGLTKEGQNTVIAWTQSACGRRPAASDQPTPSASPSVAVRLPGEVMPGTPACDLATEYVPAEWIDDEPQSFDEQAHGQGLIGWPTDRRPGCGTFFTGGSQVIVYPTSEPVDAAVVLYQLRSATARSHSGDPFQIDWELSDQLVGIWYGEGEAPQRSDGRTVIVDAEHQAAEVIVVQSEAIYLFLQGDDLQTKEIEALIAELPTQ